jgi:hypothetical protein
VRYLFARERVFSFDQKFKMVGYASFLKNHKVAQTETEQLEILKKYLFSLSNEDFAAFLNMGNMVEDVRFILAEGTEKNRQNIIETLDSMEAIILKSKALSAKAA